MFEQPAVAAFGRSPCRRRSPGRRPLGAASIALALAAAAGADPVYIATILDGPSERQEERYLPLFQREILALTEGEFDVRFEPRHQWVGDWSPEGLAAAVDAALADDEVDLVVALGVLASHTFCCREALPKPVIAPLVIDPLIQGLPVRQGTSGVPNLNYLSLPDTLERDLEVFRRIVPFRRLVVLSNQDISVAFPEISRRAGSIYSRLGLEARVVRVGTSASEAVAAVPDDAQAVYLYPLHQLPEEEHRRLIAGLTARRLPTWSYLGERDVEAGVLAGLLTSEYMERLARRVALNVQRILLGDDPGSLSVHFSSPTQLRINMATARAIGVYPSWEMLLEADLVAAEEVRGAARWSLRSAVEAALAANLDLAAGRLEVAAGAPGAAIARARRRPAIDVSLSGVRVDRDRGASIFFPQGETTVTGSLGISQLLVSDASAAAVTVEERLQESRRLRYEQLRLDVTLAAATSYLEVLRARTLERVQRDNLKLTRSHLELARIRRSLGSAGAAEVIRWEAELATDQRAVVEAAGGRRRVEIVFNRLLHRPLAELFSLADVGLEDPELIVSSERLPVYTADPKRYELLQDFVVREGLVASPELAELDRQIAAQARSVVAARRSFWLPTVGLRGLLEDRLAEGGAGIDGAIPGLPPGIAGPPSTTWSLGLNASLDLFAGGARRAETIRAEEELVRLRASREALAERVEARIRTALIAANASYQGIGLADRASEAAGESLRLVTEAYSRGAVPILDLLDAQNRALVASESSANAVYDFLIDLMEVQRAADRFDFFLSDEDRRRWLERVERFFIESGVPEERLRTAAEAEGGSDEP